MPTIQVRFSTVCRSEFACGRSLLLDEVRQARVGGGPEEAGREAGDDRERDDRPALSRTAAATKTPRRTRSATIISPPPREPVDERAEQQADRDRRQEVGDQQRADPAPRAGPVVDVDRRARSSASQRPEPGAERREEEAPEARVRRSSPAARRRCPAGGPEGTLAPPTASNERVAGLSRIFRPCAAAASGRRGERVAERGALRRADGDADRARGAEAGSGRTITPSRSRRSNSGPRSSPMSA